jgi:hypothetical protein
MAFQIPKEGRKSLAQLLKASPKFLDAFYDALKECEPRLSPRDTSILSARLSVFDEIDSKMLSGFLRLINGALSASDDEPADKIASDLFVSAQSTADKDLAANDADWAKVRDFLTKTFSLETVRVSAKALGLYYETPRHVHGVRIITDARPVFAAKPNEDPSGFVIIHTLHVDYYEDRQSKEWYISLDAEDLNDLKTAIDRAVEKQSSLQRVLKKTDSIVFTSNGNFDEAS